MNRTMQVVAIIGSFVVLAVVLANLHPRADAASSDFKNVRGIHMETIERELPLEPGAKLQVTNSNGAIRLSTWDEAKVKIVAEKRMTVRGGVLGTLLGLGRSLGSAEEAAEHFAALRMEITGDESDLRVDTIYPKRIPNANLSVEYTIYAPESLQASLKTGNGKIRVEDVVGSANANSSNGKVELTNIIGPIQAKTNNGSVICDAVQGPVEATSSNGSITIVQNRPLSASDGITCRTSNGSIKLALDRASSFEVNANTSNGSIRTDFDVADRNARNRKRLSGRVGEGGPTIELRTSNGSIALMNR